MFTVSIAGRDILTAPARTVALAAAIVAGKLLPVGAFVKVRYGPDAFLAITVESATDSTINVTEGGQFYTLDRTADHLLEDPHPRGTVPPSMV